MIDMKTNDVSKRKLEIVGDTSPQNAAHDPRDIFNDIEALRKASKPTVQRKSVLVNVSVDKPPGNSYFRAHCEHLLDNATIVRDDQGAGRSIYFIAPSMRSYPKLAPRLRWVTLGLIALWPADTVQIWPVPILGGRNDFKVWKSARAAYELSREKWTQLVWSEAASDYAVEVAEGIDHTPNWPDKSFEELLKLGFDGKIVDSENHDFVRRLRGLID
jgi:hypothetical protein